MLVLKGVHNRKLLLGHCSLGQLKPLLLQNRGLCICFRKCPVERIRNLLQQWCVWWEACNDQAPHWPLLLMLYFSCCWRAAARRKVWRLWATQHVSFSSPLFITVFWLRVDFQRHQQLEVLLCPLSLAFLPELNMTLKLRCCGEEQSPDSMHRLTIGPSPLHLGCQSPPSSAVTGHFYLSTIIIFSHVLVWWSLQVK